MSIASCRKANRSSYQERRGRSVRTVRKRKYQPGKLFTEPLEPGSEDTEGSQTRALPPGSRGRWPRATRIADLIEGGVEAWPAGSGAQAADCLRETRQLPKGGVTWAGLLESVTKRKSHKTPALSPDTYKMMVVKECSTTILLPLPLALCSSCAMSPDMIKIESLLDPGARRTWPYFN